MENELITPGVNQDPGGAPPSPSTDPSQASITAPASTPSSPAAPSPAATPEFRSVLSNYGIDASAFQTDDQARAFYGRLTPQYVSQLYQQAQWAQQMLPRYREWQAQQAQAQAQPQLAQPPAAPAQPEKPPYWPAQPEWNAAWAQKIVPDGQGGYRLRDPIGDNPAILDKYQQYRDWQRERLEAILADPRKAIGLDDYVKENLASFKDEVQQLVAQQFAEVAATQQNRGYIAENAPWLFQTDQNGQPLRDPMTGHYVFSDTGRQAYSIIQRLESGDERQKMDIAFLAATAIQQMQQQQQPGAGGQPAVPGMNGNGQPQQPQAPWGQQPFMGGPGYSPPRTGTFNPSPISAPQNPSDLEGSLRAAMAARGLL